MSEFEDGIELGRWLETSVRPKLKRWAKSGDDRVRLQASVLTSAVDLFIGAKDWAGLAALRRAWEEAEAPVQAELPPPPDET